MCVRQTKSETIFSYDELPASTGRNLRVAKFSPVLSILHADFTVIQDYRASLVSFVISSGVWVRNTTTSQPSHSLWNIHSGHTFGSLFDADQDPANTFLNELFFTGFSVHFGDWYRAITCSLVRFFHTLRSCVVAGESQTCHRFVCATRRHLPEAQPIEGRIAAINFMIISLRSSDCSLGGSDRNHGKTATTNREIIKSVQQKIFLSHDWPRLHVRCDRFNVQHSTERFFFSGERQAANNQHQRRWKANVKLMNEMRRKENRKYRCYLCLWWSSPRWIIRRVSLLITTVCGDYAVEGACACDVTNFVHQLKKLENLCDFI